MTRTPPPSAEQLDHLVDAAGRRRLTPDENAALRAGVRQLRASLAGTAAALRRAPSGGYHQQLVQQLADAETELGQRRTQVAELVEQRDEARSWARHGYEIGQRHCGWTDHGVAPTWLTEGWPLRIEACEAATRAEQAEARIAAVRAVAGRDQDGLCCSHVTGDLRRLLGGATTSTAAAVSQAAHDCNVWEDDGEWNVSCPSCTAGVDNIGNEDDAQEWATDHKAREAALAAVAGPADTAEATTSTTVATCGPDCDGGHTYDGQCLVDPQFDSVIGQSTDPQHPGWYWSCEGAASGCEGWFSLDHASAAAARRSYDRHVARDHQAAEARP
ncbi:hypothetical protein [Kitasatospora sp. NPDC005748]|uniref:hypothetical protein n=1 Tax=Kitasatospora sp. NPDC005748 TaxID=3157063 RepID=UPI0033C43251